MKKIYTMLALLISSTLASAQCSDIFFSEYAEGSSNHKYLEIYNSSPSDINLDDYLLVSCSNGCGDMGLNGSWELTKIGVGPNKGDIGWYNTDINSSTRGCLADDRVVFHNGGAFQNLMGSETWLEGWQSGAAEGCAKPVAPFDGSKMGTWKDHGDGTFTVYGKGSHVGIPKATNGGEINNNANAPDSVKYEYKIDGDTAMTVDVNFGGGWWRYEYKKVSNSFEYNNSGLFSGKTVKAGEVFVIAHPDADATIAAKGDTTHRFLSNGDDWYALWKKSDYSLVDEIGELGPDPGSGWEVSGTANATKDKTLVRKASTKSGADWATSSKDQWEVYAQNTWTYLGAHDCDCYPAYIVADIVDVVDLDADLAPNNSGIKYEITGVVYGIDYDGNAGLSFTIIDATSGINIFNFVDVSDYVVTEGDEITARGEIDFYNGLLELKVDSIKVNSSGNTLAKPTLVAKPTEDTESEFIQLEKVWIADGTTEWPDNGNVLLTNDAMDTFQIRIDKDIPGIVGEAVAFDTMTIVGIGGQFDGSAPYDEGYQIFPRGLDDIMEWKSKVSVKELNRVAVGVYPNPTSGAVQLLGNNSWNTYRVYNTVGVEVMSGNITGNTITLSGLENGCYFIETANNELVGITRVILNK